MSAEVEPAESLNHADEQSGLSKDQTPTDPEDEAHKVSLEPSEDEDVDEGEGKEAIEKPENEPLENGENEETVDVQSETVEGQEDINVPEEGTEAKESESAGEEKTVIDREGTEGIAAPPALVIKPTLRGVYDDEQGTWVGEWAMSAAEFDNGLRGKFEYKRDKKIPDEDIGKPPMVDRQPKDMYVSGYFTLLQQGKMKKIPEKDILMRFSASPDDESISVQGFGKNNIGTFSLSGAFDPSTSALHLDREYQKPLTPAPASAVKNQLKKKAATPRSTPRAIPMEGEDMTWGSTATAAAAASAPVTGPAAAVSQRVRRAPPRIDDAEVETNKKNTQRMLPIVDRLLKADARQFFHVPVDPVLLGIPNYLDIIEEPMDLGTIKQNLIAGIYDSEDQVAEHIVLTFRNAMIFNPKETIVYNDAKQLLATFEAERSKLTKRPAAQDKDKKRKSTGNIVDSKRLKSSGRQASMRSDDSRYSSGDDEDYDEGPTIPYNKPTKSGRRSVPTTHYDPYNQTTAAAVSGSATENEELRLLRRQVEMMSQQLESLKAVTMQSQQLSMQTQQLQHQIAAASARAYPADIDMEYMQAPVAAPKRARAPPKPKQPRQSYAATAPALSPELDDDILGAGRGPKIERPLSYQEKRTLGQDINKLPADKVQRVIDIIAESGSQMIGDGTEEVEIDIEKLDTPTLKALQKYVREVLRGEKKKAIKEGVM